MSIEGILILIGVLLLLFGALAWLFKGILKQSEKDWAICKDFEERAKTVKTKEEIKTFHAELVEKGNCINNHYVRARLNVVEAYLRGLYQNAK